MTDSPFAAPERWPTAITAFDRDRILIRGHDVQGLMECGNFADVAFLLMAGRQPTAGESAVWNAILIASSDHGPTSPSTFAARVIASGNRRAPEAAVGGGILAIGDAHGGAGEEAMGYLQEGLVAFRKPGGSLRLAAQSVVDRYRREKRRMPGLGHRFHPVDPRTDRLWRISEKNGLRGDGITLMQEIRAVLSATVSRNMPVNVDGAIAAALVDMQFAPPIARMAFILGRTAGIVTHVLEEIERERPMRFRFDFRYDGPTIKSDEPMHGE